MDEQTSVEPTAFCCPNDAVICFCNSNRAWGGGENWHLQAARYFAERGCRVILACCKDSPLGLAAKKLLEKQKTPGMDLQLADWSFKNTDFINPFRISSFASFLRDHGVTHLICGLPADLKTGVMAVGRIAAKPRLYYRRGSAIPVKQSLSNRFFYSRLDALIVNSQETARCVLQNRGIINPQKVHIIYNSLDTESFDRKLAAYAASESAALRTGIQSGESAPAFVIGNAGRLNRQKGQKFLLHMSAVLKQRGFRHQLIIAGTGELQGELEALAAGLGLEYGFGLNCGKELCFAGFLEDMSPFWAGIDIFVLSSLWEGFGYVLAESMLARKPVCAFNCNSMPELVKDGVNGLLIPPPGPDSAPEEIGNAMADIVLKLAKNPDMALQMGEAGRDFCLKNFSQGVTMAQLAALLFNDA